jgi:cell division protein FtsL
MHVNHHAPRDVHTRARPRAAFVAWVQGFLWVFLVVLIFLTVYIKDVQRRRFIVFQNLNQNAALMKVQYSQWLLEESTLSNPMRVARLARKQGLALPRGRQWGSMTLYANQEVPDVA